MHQTVPPRLVVGWSAVIHECGEITSQPGHVIDFMATFLDVAEAVYPSEFNGRRPLPLKGKSLLPIFKGEQRKGHEMLCWSTRQHHAIRMGRWKAIRPRGGGAWQLFDLETDGTETTDLAGREPERVEEMASCFEAWRGHVRAE